MATTSTYAPFQNSLANRLQYAQRQTGSRLQNTLDAIALGVKSPIKDLKSSATQSVNAYNLDQEKKSDDDKSYTQNPVKEGRSPEEVFETLEKLSSVLSERWDAYDAHQKWKKTSQDNPEPEFTPTYDIDSNGAFIEISEEERKSIPSSEALSPCPLINRALGEFFTLTTEIHTPKETTEILKIAQDNPNVKASISALRDIAIHAEEEMERQSLNTLFSCSEQAEAGLLPEGNPFEQPCESTVEAKLGRMKELLFSYPNQLKQNADNLLQDQGIALKDFESTHKKLCEKENLTDKETAIKTALEHTKLYPFPFFDNYPDLAGAETALTQIPTKIMEKRDKYPDVETLLTDKPKIRSKVDNILKDNHLDDDTKIGKISKYVNEHPNYFGIQDYQDKTIAFIGGGSCPLTAICQAVQTGAKINIVDIDPQVVKDLEKLIPLLEKSGVIQERQMKAILGDATDLTLKKGKEEPSSEGVIEADHVVIASAIPPEATKSMLKKLPFGQSRPSVGKRDVAKYGLTSFLYYNSGISPKKVLAETGTPQGVLGLDHKPTLGRIMQLTDPENVNTFIALKPPSLSSYMRSKMTDEAKSAWEAFSKPDIIN